ncbi:MAG: hypothetical protein RLP44_06595 [Aggregatilineales bacterium]
MTDHALVLNLSDELYEIIKKTAESSRHSLEEAAIALLELPYSLADLETEIENLNSYSHVQLWAVVYKHLSAEQSARLQVLIDKSKTPLFTGSEKTELDALVSLVDRYMLLRTEALVLLQKRGYDIKSYLNPQCVSFSV